MAADILNTVVFDWLKLVLGYGGNNIIRADQNGPRPTGAYATFMILDSDPSDYSLTTKTQLDPPYEDFVKADYQNKRDVRVQVDIYNDITARVALEKLEQSRYTLASRLLFRAQNMVLLGSSIVRNLTGIGDTEHKPRFSCDYNVRLNSELSETYERIKEYEIDGDILP